MCKKNGGVLREGTLARFRVIEQNEKVYAIAMMCRALEVSQTGYYAYRTRSASNRELENQELLEQIRTVQKATRQAYGSPRMTRELRTKGKTCGRHRVARLMRKNGLGARRKKRFRKTTDSNHSFPCAENLVAREFTVSEPNRVWVADVTFIPTRERWLYLATTLDLYSRKIVGWGMGTENDTELVLRSLDMAVKNRCPGGNLIFHSDQGSTYAATAFTDELKRLGITASMSRKGDCWDNAVAESFFSSYKTEWMPENGYDTITEGMADVFRYIEE
ncbi:MAG: IS3 family transposase, partial [Candidatus Eisenbacteria bacterium]|nr:IS3 family transposase [Candidatus Eisenbacteria bacterium]